MLALAAIDAAQGGRLWVHWPLNTWGAALACHATLNKRHPQQPRSRGRATLRIHEVVFGATVTMLFLADLAGGGGFWFHWPFATWGTALLIHEAGLRRYGRRPST